MFPGNANLPIGAWQNANREIGVPRAASMQFMPGAAPFAIFKGCGFRFHYSGVKNSKTNSVLLQFSNLPLIRRALQQTNSTEHNHASKRGKNISRPRRQMTNRQCQQSRQST